MKSLLLLLAWIAGPVAQADELKLYFYPSPHGVSWEAPRVLARSVLSNAAAPTSFPLRHEIGHATVELRCESFFDATGMTESAEADDQDALLRRKIGLGILFETMPGRLQSQDEVRDDIRSRLRKGRVSWLAIDIRPELLLKAFLMSEV